MKRILGFLMAIMIGIGLFTFFGGVDMVYAAETSGTSGTCSWEVKNGTLRIYPTDGVSGTLGLYGTFRC